MFGYVRDEQMLRYIEFARQPNVRTVCEVGFNGGHSAAMWLNANPAITLHVFDLDVPFVHYTRPAAHFLSELFGKRFNWHAGDSKHRPRSR
jgi:hypothetical protein